MSFKNEKMESLSLFNFLGTKTQRKNRKLLTKLDQNSVNKTYSIVLNDSTNKYCKFKLKKNRNSIIKKKLESNKLFEISLGEINKDIVKPRAPHNTSEFIINNFTSSKRENIKKMDQLAEGINKTKTRGEGYVFMTEFDDFYMSEEVDDICISGGSMKGTFNYLPCIGIDMQIVNELGQESENIEKFSTYVTDISTDENYQIDIVTEYKDDVLGNSFGLNKIQKTDNLIYETEEIMTGLNQNHQRLKDLEKNLEILKKGFCQSIRHESPLYKYS
jgi:hypothetical protein